MLEVTRVLKVHDCVRSGMVPIVKTGEEDQVGIVGGARGRGSARGP